MARTIEEIEQRAEDLRKALHMSTVRSPDVATVLERIRELWPKFKVETRLDHDLPREEAYFDSTRTALVIRQTALTAALAGKPRARMTVFHEIGHFILGHQGTRSRMSGVDFRSANSRRAGADEAEARRFAAAFAAPRSLLSDAKSELDIEEGFSMSADAARLRFEEIEQHRRKLLGERRKLPGIAIDFLEELKKRGHPIKSLD